MEIRRTFGAVAALAVAILFAAPQGRAESAIVSVIVSPASPAIGTGGTQQFKAQAVFGDGSTLDATNLASWSSSDTSIATVGASSGLVTGVAGGTSTITATYSGQLGASPVNVVLNQTLSPATTNPAIPPIAPAASDYHYVAEPASGRKNILVIFFGGSGSEPASYEDISNRAAADGYGVIDLRYEDSQVIGSVCATDDSCFTQLRGEIIFGNGVSYDNTQPSYAYNTGNQVIPEADSALNRIVNLLDYLARQPASAANPDPGYWKQFLTGNKNSPYKTVADGTYPGGADPVWSKIVLSGHSQGGGHAAFLAVHLPTTSPARRVAMFSSPDDCIKNTVLKVPTTCPAASSASASWVLDDVSATPMKNFWALRNEHEGDLGNNETYVWSSLGGSGGGGVGASSQAPGLDTEIGDGSGNPGGSHRLMLSTPDSVDTMHNHDSTAVDSEYLYSITAAWDYLFTANGSD
jgi:hypothetical protein